MEENLVCPTQADIARAAERIRGQVLETEVRELPGVEGVRVWLKCENLQHGRAFKLRGATNALLALKERGALRAVATQSSGNHGAAIARAAKALGIPAYVVVPRTVSPVKLQLIREAGAEVTLCEPTMVARDAAAREIVERTGAAIVHPYDDAEVMAGAGTAALEFRRQVPALQAMILPVSGGGLLGGTAIALEGSGIDLFAAEPLLANDAAQSLRTGRLHTTDAHTGLTQADGLRAALSPRTFAAIRGRVREIFEVTEDEITAAMALVEGATGMRIEPSSAVTVAAVVKHRTQFAGRVVGLMITGGNV